MRIEDFEDILDRRGSDVGAWPEAAAARALLDRSADARRMLEEARLLRRAFQAEAPIRAPAGLTDRILREALAASPAAPAPEQAPGQAARPYRPLEWLRDIGAAVFHSDAMLRPAAVLAVCFVTGMLASYATVEDTSSLPAEVSQPTFFTYFDLS